MTDIHTIKNLLYFLPYLKEETWYMLGAGTTIYIIYIAYLIAFERYYASHPTETRAPIQTRTIQEILDSLQIEDVRFFEKLSFVIRTYLEDNNQVALATKKTPRDIRAESISQELKDILETCMYHEYAQGGVLHEEKIRILDRVKNIL